MPSSVEVNIMPVVGEAASMKVDTAELPPVIPILALRNAVVFPGTVFPVTVGREKSVKLVQAVEAGSGWLAAMPRRISCIFIRCRFVRVMWEPTTTSPLITT